MKKNNRQASRKLLKSFVERLVRQFRPERVVLFGSYAWGKPTGQSDIDLLVIMPFEGSGIRKASEIALAVPPPFPLDLIVRTPDQVRHRLQCNDFFLREILEKGTVLYEASHVGVD